jgi:ABC-type xylose transport system permease subunit
MSGVAAQSNKPTARRSINAFTATWASQIGITVAFLALWLVFIAFAPGTFLSDRIYLSFAQTTPYFALMALPLTMVIIAGDIDLSFPSIMALGMVGFVFAWQGSSTAWSSRSSASHPSSSPSARSSCSEGSPSCSWPARAMPWSRRRRLPRTI